MVSIAVQHVSVTYRVKATTVTALHDVSFQIPAGSFVALVGPSGCGKTTLLRAIGGLIEPDAGQITLGALGPDQARRRRMVGFMFQQPVLLPWKTAVQNIELPLQLAGWRRQRRRERAHEVLELVGLSDFAGAYPHQLSGGMQQRVALARVLADDPAVFLMDEPFAAVDELTREYLNGELLRVWSTSQATVLFVTHSLSEAVFLADRVLVMSEQPGHVGAEVTVPLHRPRTSTLFEQPAFLRCVNDVRRELSRGRVYDGGTENTN
jgi:NitT/TauT family transport system ATP-binding protein